MKLYLLKFKRDRESAGTPGEYQGFVIRAGSVLEARHLAFETASEVEEKDYWLHEEITSCEEINEAGDKKVLLSDYYNSESGFKFNISQYSYSKYIKTVVE